MWRWMKKLKNALTSHLERSPGTDSEGLSSLPHLFPGQPEQAVAAIIEYHLPNPKDGSDEYAMAISHVLARSGTDVIAALKPFMLDENLPLPHFFRSLIVLRNILIMEQNHSLKLPNDFVDDHLVAAIFKRGLCHENRAVQFRACNLFHCRRVAANETSAAAAQALLWWLVDDSGEERWFLAAKDAFAAIGEKALPALRTALQAPYRLCGVENINSPVAEREARFAIDRICRVLDDMKEDTVAKLSQEIVRAMKKWPKSQYRLAVTLARISRDRGAVADEVAAMLPEVHEDARLPLCWYLAQGKIGFPHLVALLNGPFAVHALEVLARLDVDEPAKLVSARPRLVELLDDSRVDVLLKAARLLGTMGKLAAEDEKVLPKLEALSKKVNLPEGRPILANFCLAIFAIKNDKPQAVNSRIKLS